MTPILDRVLLMLGSLPAVALLLKASFVLALALAAARLARRRSAAVKHAILAAGFAVLVLLPIGSITLPALSLAVPAAPASAPLQVVAGLAAAPNLPRTAPPAPRGLAVAPLPFRLPLSLSLSLMAAWLVGAVLFFLPVALGLWQVRRLRRTALPWRDAPRPRLRAEIVLHESISGPLTFGARLPLVMMPLEARSWPREDLERTLMHELEHVRRKDWVTQCVARAACALYWFLPLAWAAWRQLTLEAERACDDVVLRRADALGYADQLVGFASRQSAVAHAPLLAFANRTHLATRIRAVLDPRQRRGRLGVGTAGASALAAIGLVAVLSPLRTIAKAPNLVELAQQKSGSAAPLVFAAATMKPSNEGSAFGGCHGIDSRMAPNDDLLSVPLGRCVFRAVRLSHLLSTAYSMDLDNISGLPDWDRPNRYDIQAEADNPATTTEAQLLMMLQAFLTERFQLKLHRAHAEVSGFALVVGNKVPKFHASTQQASSAPELNGTSVTWKGYTMAEFAQFLSMLPSIGRPVEDMTGLTGRYDFKIDLMVQPGGDDNTKRLIGGWQSAITDIQDQLGLKFESHKVPVDTLVIDHAEKPALDR